MTSYKMFINGEWVDAVSKATFEDFNPYTGKVYATVPKGDVKDAGLAMESAYAARKAWAGTAPHDRAQILYKAARIMEEKCREFAAVLTEEGGGAFGKTMFEISQTVKLLQTAGGDCERVLGETFHTDPGKLSMTMLKPRGTIVGISPWNFPLILSMFKVAYGLATGNTVVLKPASDTPVIGLKIGELFQESGLLPGALNVITGPGSVLGDALIDHKYCSYITLTGDSNTGKHVAQRAAANLKEYMLELGGKNPLIILADADMDFAVNTAAFGVFMHQGEICMAVGRIIIEESIAEEFSRRLTKKAESIAFGDPSRPETIVGPLINDKQVQRVHALVTDAKSKGAKLLHGGSYEGRVYQPTVLSGVTPEMNIYHEETFGPVASIIPVKDEKEALRVANDTNYGLSSGVITDNLQKALYLAEGLEAGMVHVNDSSIDADEHCPFGGCKWSGQGREGGRYSIEKFSEIKWVTIQKGKKVFPF